MQHGRLATPDEGPRRLGIGGRLLAAFGVIAAFTIAATLVAWFLFADVRENLAIITEDSLPEIAASFRIAQESAGISAAIPRMVIAESAQDLAAAKEALGVRLDSIAALADAHDVHGHAITRLVEELQDVARNIRVHVRDLELAVGRSLTARRKRVSLLDALSAEHKIFIDAVEPIIETAHGDLVAFTRHSVADGDNIVLAIDEGIESLENLLFMHSDTNQMFGLLGEAGTAIYSGDIEAFRLRYDALRNRILERLIVYESSDHDPAVRSSVEAVLAYGEGDRSILSSRFSELEADEAASITLAQTQALAARMSESARGLVEDAEQTAADAKLSTRGELSRGELVLVGIAALSLLVVLLIAWLYVYRGIVRRLTGLSSSMQSIASGDLDTEIVARGGDDEISDMREALVVFRDDAFRRRQAEEAVRESEQRLRLILATSPVGVGISRVVDGIVVYANDHLASQFRSTAAEFVGSRAWDFYADAEDRQRLLTRVESDGSVRDAEVRFKRSDDSEFWSLLSFFPIEFGGETANLGWVYDITDRKKAEEELRVAKDQAESALADLKAAQQRLVQTEKMASLGQLTAGVAHEIKNPLNFVKNFAEVSTDLLEELKENLQPAIEKLKASERQDAADQFTSIDDMLAKIREHGVRADRIVQSMLSHTREGPATTRPTDLNALLKESLDLAYHAARAEDKVFNVTLESNLDPEVGELELYPADLMRVFLNLIGNAFYATRKRASEQGESGYAPTVAISTKRTQDKVEVRVRDNGGGVPANLKKKIFDPFFTTKPPGEGTGLGLSLSYETVVQQHEGWMEVSSEEGQFTEFLVTLPR